MTKKDYEVIAKVINRQGFMSLDGNFNKKVLAQDLAIELLLQNPRFNREKFLLACGVNE